MAYRALLLDVAEDVPAEYAHFATPGAGILVCDPPAVYRPRHPEAQVFYQVFEHVWSPMAPRRGKRRWSRAEQPRRANQRSSWVERRRSCRRSMTATRRRPG